MRQTRPELWVAPSKQFCLRRLWNVAITADIPETATKWHRPADCSIHGPQPPETHGHRQLTGKSFVQDLKLRWLKRLILSRGLAWCDCFSSREKEERRPVRQEAGSEVGSAGAARRRQLLMSLNPSVRILRFAVRSAFEKVTGIRGLTRGLPTVSPQ